MEAGIGFFGAEDEYCTLKTEGKNHQKEAKAHLNTYIAPVIPLGGRTLLVVLVPIINPERVGNQMQESRRSFTQNLVQNFMCRFVSGMTRQ